MKAKRLTRAKMTPRTLNAWRWRRALLAVVYVVSWLVVSQFLTLVVAFATSGGGSDRFWLVFQVVMLLIIPVGIIVWCVLGRAPGTGAPYAGSACRACKEDLAPLLPGDGEAVDCPECGCRNRIAPPRCGACGYDLRGVPTRDGWRRCPECGHGRQMGAREGICAACGYDVGSVPVIDGVRTCPECGESRRGGGLAERRTGPSG